MGIGFSIFLLALGAILTFALDSPSQAWTSTSSAGSSWRLALVGLVLTMVVVVPRRRRTVTETTEPRPSRRASSTR